MLKIKGAALATSAVMPSQYPEETLPAVALIGRSNAGKSSLINTMINRKNLARTSSAPGKTRLLNFYRIEAADEQNRPLPFYFVDLPGYGYAKVAKSEREQWLGRIEKFLASYQQRLLCWQLVDIRHAPSAEDRTMYAVLSEAGFDLHVVANKADKISRNQRPKQVKQIAEALRLPTAAITVFSAISREGKEPLLQAVEQHIAAWWAENPAL